MQRNKLDVYIPDGNNLPDFLQAVSLIAANRGLELTTFTPSRDLGSQASEGRLRELEVQVETSGNLENLLSLVRDIEDNQRFVGIRDLKIQSGEEGSGEINLSLVIYYLN